MNTITHHRGIAGLEGREPVGVVLSVGRKNESGRPIENDRFHLVTPKEDENKRRPHHTAFRWFNELPPGNRKTLNGVLVHGREDECFDFHLRCRIKPGKPGHPNRLPFCVGDGSRATRWVGPGPDDFQEMACPHDRCEYRQAPAGNGPTPCTPFGRLLFHLTWPQELRDYLVSSGRGEAQEMLCKYQTGSWNTIRNLRGFFDRFKSAAAGLRMSEPSLFGFPFTITLTRGTNPARKSAFPVCVFTPAMEPTRFFLSQRDTMDRLSHEAPRAALTHDDQRDPRVVAEDYATITPGLPAQVEEISQ